MTRNVLYCTYLSDSSWFYDILGIFALTFFFFSSSFDKKSEGTGHRAQLGTLYSKATEGNSKMADPAWMSDPPPQEQPNDFSAPLPHLPPAAYIEKAKTDR